MAQTRRVGMQSKEVQLPNAPRPPTQTTSFAKAMEDRSARPSLKGLLTERRGRDVGFAKSGFRPTDLWTPYPTAAVEPRTISFGANIFR
jgi:hypothetical protein